MKSLHDRHLFLASLFTTCFILSGCVVAEKDPALYQQKAKHIERHYTAPFDKLTVCLFENSKPTQYQYHIMRKEAFYGIKGVFEVRLYEMPGDKTLAEISGKPGHFDTRPEKWIGILDRCDAALAK